jgi:3-hydroxyacyl-CoA dehydrogenase
MRMRLDAVGVATAGVLGREACELCAIAVMYQLRAWVLANRLRRQAEVIAASEKNVTARIL